MTLLPLLLLLAGAPENPSLTVKKPMTVAASFTTFKLYAFTVDLSVPSARTAFQSWDDTAEKKWSGFVVVIDTDQNGSKVSRSDGKKSDCPVKLDELLSAIDKAGRDKKPALTTGVQTALFGRCVDLKE